MLDLRRAAAKLLWFLVVVMAWRAMPLRLLNLMAGLGRAVPRGCRPNSGGTPGPVRVTGRELMTAATPRKFAAVNLYLPPLRRGESRILATDDEKKTLVTSRCDLEHG